MTRAGERRAGAVLRPLLSLFLVLVVGTAGCRNDAPSRDGDPAVDADVRVSPTPAAVGEARIFVVATDAGAPLEGGTVRVRAFPAADADAAPPAATWHPAAAAPGGHGPVALDFPTPGRWWIEVEMTASDGRRAVVRHPLSVVTGG